MKQAEQNGLQLCNCKLCYGCNRNILFVVGGVVTGFIHILTSRILGLSGTFQRQIQGPFQ